MAQATKHTDYGYPILSLEEAYELFDNEVRRLMGVSGEEFIERWESGELKKIADEAGNRHIMRLALMMPRDSSRS